MIKSWRDVERKYEPHPLALLFPALDDDAFAGLCADISKHGLIHSIVVLDGQILDGWHRYKACLKTGVAPMVHQFTGSNPAAYVLSANLHRRHLNLTTEQKRTLIGQVLKESPELSNRQVAKITKTHHETVEAERMKLESRGEIATSETRADAKGRKQPAHKAAKPKSIIEKFGGPELKPGQTIAGYISEMRRSLAQPRTDTKGRHQPAKKGKAPPLPQESALAALRATDLHMFLFAIKEAITAVNQNRDRFSAEQLDFSAWKPAEREALRIEINGVIAFLTDLRDKLRGKSSAPLHVMPS